MKRFVEGEDRLQGALLSHCLDDYVTENNPVRVIEAFIDEPTPFAGTRRDLWYPYRSKRCDFGLETGRDLAKIGLIIGRPYHFEKTR